MTDRSSITTYTFICATLSIYRHIDTSIHHTFYRIHATFKLIAIKRFHSCSSLIQSERHKHSVEYLCNLRKHVVQAESNLSMIELGGGLACIHNVENGSEHVNSVMGRFK